MDTEITFSIIVAVYNVEAYIKECVDSIINQSYKKYEIILVDDGSTDTSGDICRNYAEQYHDCVKVVHKENGGLSDARNAGVLVASGDYIIFIDGDDYVDGNMLNNMAMCISEDNSLLPDVILSECLCRVDEKGNVTSEYKFISDEFAGKTGADALKKTSPIRANWSACGKAYRLLFWNEHNFMFKKHRSWEDFQLIDKVVLEASKVCMVPAFYYYRYRTTSITHTVSDIALKGILCSIDEWDKYLHNKKLDSELEKLIRNRIAFLFCQTVMGYASIARTNDSRGLLKTVSGYKWVLKYGNEKSVKIISFCCTLIGFGNTCRLLGIIKKMRYGIR